jgi:hypothetical protein
MGRTKLGRETCNITLPPELVKKIDAEAKTTGRTRSQFLQMLAEIFFDGAAYGRTLKRPGKAKAAKP